MEKDTNNQTNQTHKNKLSGPRKTFQQDGHWIVKPRTTEILMCGCGNRYLKTRPAQVMCVRCLFKKK